MAMFLLMGFVILISLAVIGGLFYFMKKESDRNANGEAVPIMDVSELKGLTPDKTKTEHGGFFSSAINQTHEESQDELTSARSKLAALEGGMSTNNAQVEKSATDSAKDQSPAKHASDSHLVERIQELESQMTMITQKAVEQAEEAVKVIETLMKENAQLKMNQSALSSGVEDASKVSSIVELKEQNGLLDSQLDLSSSKVAQLESQVVIIKKELGQHLLEANATIARLKVEGEAQERVTQDSLLKEKQELEQLREASSRQLREMEDGFMKAKEENLLLKDAKKLLEAKLAVVDDDFKSELAQAKELVNNLVTQKEEQAQQVGHLERDVTKLKELNATLIDKAKILQYELNRHRIQASGLERVCANFKTQMEAMFGQVEQAKKDNNRLLQERINLEAGVASLRSENVRLSERDKTYQHELEKTKEQINRFENIYKNFKSDVGGVSDGKTDKG